MDCGVIRKVVPGLVMLRPHSPANSRHQSVAGWPLSICSDPYHPTMANSITFMPRSPRRVVRVHSVLMAAWAVRRWNEGACARFTANLSIYWRCTNAGLYLPKLPSFHHHYSGLLATPCKPFDQLLRWNASLSRDGNLFTRRKKSTEIAALP